MRHSPFLSFIIPTYNSANTIVACLDSVLKNKTDYVYEIVIVDDGSTDNTIEVINNMRDLSNIDINIVLQQHLGAQEARKNGFKKSKGEIVFFLDSDDYIADNFINEICQPFLETKTDLLIINGYCVDGKQTEILIPTQEFIFAQKHGFFSELRIHGMFGYNCCHVFSRSLYDLDIINNSKTLSFTEDLNLMLDICLNKEFVVDYLNLPLYYYNYDNHELYNLFTLTKCESVFYVIKKRFSLIKSNYSYFLDEFFKYNSTAVLDWLYAIWKTKNISKKQKRMVRKKIKTDFDIKQIMLFKSFIKSKHSIKDWAKYLLFWVF